MSKEENGKKGISLVGFVIFLIILVCIEGGYIVTLKSESNEDTIGNSDIVIQPEDNIEDNEIEDAKTEDTELEGNEIEDVETENVETDNTETKDTEIENSEIENTENDAEIENAENVETENDTTETLNDKIIEALGYDVNTMINSIIDSFEIYAESGKLSKFQPEIETKELATIEYVKSNREDYENIMVYNFNNSEFVNTIKYENGKLTCEYNIKNILNILGLESNNYQELEANENNLKTYDFK